MAIKIDRDVISILADSTPYNEYEDLTAGISAKNVLFLPQDDNGQAIPLDRKLYMKVDKVLKALGGKWDRRVGGHLFSVDPTDIIEQAGFSKIITRKLTNGIAIIHMASKEGYTDR